MTSPDRTTARKRARRARRLSGAAVIAIALGAIGTLYAALAPSSQAAKSADPAVERGRQLYLQGCSSCHGINGEGSERAPSLIGVGAAAVDFQVSTGRMPLQQQGAQALRKPPAWDEAQTRDIAAYVASLGPGPAIPEYANDYKDADVALGGELFRANCSQCHNFAGSGGALTYGKSAPPLGKSTPVQVYEAMITGPSNMPVFGDKVLSPEQKLAVVKFVQTVQHEANPGGIGLGRVGPISEGLLAWVFGLGLLVVFALWIGARA